MGISTKEIDVNLLEAEFYNKDFYFSYSSLNKLLYNPQNFYKEYVLKQREESIARHLLEGTMIHYLVLENQGFDDKFLVTPDRLPSDKVVRVLETLIEQNRDALERDPHLKLGDFEKEIDTILTEVDLYQFVKDQTKRLAKVIEPRAEQYFDFLKKKNGRTIIDSELLDKCTRRADIIKENTTARELLGLDLESDGIFYGVYNELELQVEKEEGELFGYKGIVDNMVIDVKQQTVYINDFKTTSKELSSFTDTVEYWNYWLQAAVYIKLVRNYLKDVLNLTWKVEFRFIVFDKNDQLYPFLVTDKTLGEWIKRFDGVKVHAEYHYESRDFSLPYNYAMGNVKL